MTWDTFVNFRLGDEISVVGFQQGLSTMPFTASASATVSAFVLNWPKRSPGRKSWKRK